MPLADCLRLLACAAAVALASPAAAQEEGGPAPIAFQSFMRGSYRMNALTERVETTVTEGTPTVTTIVEPAPVPTSFEVMRQAGTLRELLHFDTLDGVRFETYIDDWSLGVGDEVVAATSDYARYQEATFCTSGLRLDHSNSEFSWEGTGSILGRVGATVANDHCFVGPQLGFGSVAEISYWRFEALVLGAIGYQRTDFELSGLPLFEGAVPGAANHAVNARPTAVKPNVRETKEDFAWRAETRLSACCQLTRRLRCDLAWRWLFIDGQYSAQESLRYTLPQFSLKDTEPTIVDRMDLYLGMTYVF